MDVWRRCAIRLLRDGIALFKYFGNSRQHSLRLRVGRVARIRSTELAPGPAMCFKERAVPGRVPSPAMRQQARLRQFTSRAGTIFEDSP